MRLCGCQKCSAFCQLDHALEQLLCKGGELSFLKVQAALGARKNLGRPTVQPGENKEYFMEFLKEEKQIM